MLRGTTSTTKACQGERFKVEIFLSGFANDAGTVAGEGKAMRRLHRLWSYASLICAHLVIGHCNSVSHNQDCCVNQNCA